MMGLSVWDTQKARPRLEVADVTVSDHTDDAGLLGKSASE
jgi:hypothetical protein